MPDAATMRLLAPLVILAVAAPNTAAAQQAEAIHELGAAECTDCIQADRFLTIGEDEPLVCDFAVGVVGDSRGRYFVAPTCEPGQVAVVSGGSTRLIGEYGEGPQQLGNVQLVAVGSDDRLHVLQREGGRHTWFDSELNWAGSESWGIALTREAIFYDDGALLHFHRPSVDLAGKIFHEYGAGHEAIRSFGDIGVYRRDNPLQIARLVARAEGRSFWSSRLDRIELDLWPDGADAPKLRYVRPWPDNDYFATMVQSVAYEPDDELLYIIAVHARADPASLVDPADPQVPSLGEMARNTVARIIVVDTASGSVFAEQEFPDLAIGRWARPGVAYALRETAEGYAVDLLRLSLLGVGPSEDSRNDHEGGSQQ